MDDKKNIVLAVLLTAAILFGWPYIAKHFFPAANPPATKIEGGKTTPVAQGSSPVASSPSATRDRTLVLKESPRVAIRTPKLHRRYRAAHLWRNDREKFARDPALQPFGHERRLFRWLRLARRRVEGA